MAEIYKPKTAGILLIITGIGIPALLILVLVLVFLRGEIDPFASDKSDFAIIIFGSVLFLFALWLLPVIGGEVIRFIGPDGCLIHGSGDTRFGIPCPFQTGV